MSKLADARQIQNRETYNWDSPCHSNECKGGQQHDHEDDLQMSACIARWIRNAYPEGLGSSLANLLIVWLSWNDSWDRRDVGGGGGRHQQAGCSLRLQDVDDLIWRNHIGSFCMTCDVLMMLPNL